MRQFTIVCRVALKLGWNSHGHPRPSKFALGKVGLEEFGLTTHQIGRCLGRARDEIAELVRLDRVRKAGRVNFPTRSDEIIASLHKIAA